MTTRVRTRRVYEPASADEGTRVLVMRLWPRGIPRSRVDLWLRELGPVIELLRAFRSGQVSWPEYRRRYRAGLDRPPARADLDRLAGLARRGRVTLLCGCPDERRCHRTLLLGHLARRLV